MFKNEPVLSNLEYLKTNIPKSFKTYYDYNIPIAIHPKHKNNWGKELKLSSVITLLLILLVLFCDLFVRKVNE